MWEVIQLIVRLVVIFICFICLRRMEDFEEKRKYRDDQKLSSYIDLLAGVRDVVINESKENELLRNKDLSLDPYYDKKIQEAFVNCDEWDWSDRKEEDIEQH